MKQVNEYCDDPRRQWRAIPARVLVLVFLSFFVPSLFFYDSTSQAQDVLWGSYELLSAVYYLACVATWLVFLFYAAYSASGQWRIPLGTLPQQPKFWFLASLAIPSIGTSAALFYGVFAPLSYVAPQFVESWALSGMPIIWWRSDGATALANVVSIIAVVLLIPVVEEAFFRGYLLHRLIKNYGTNIAILVSSTFFAVLHPDTLGAFLFAVVMCWIVLHGRSLLGVIAIHALHNLSVVLLAAGEGAATGAIRWSMSIGELREDAWIGIVGLFISWPWLMWGWRRRHLLRPSEWASRSQIQGST